MGWDAEDVALLKKLWAAGRSAGQIALRLGQIFENPQYRARGADCGPRRCAAPVRPPGHIGWLGEGLGHETTRYSRGLLGLSGAQIDELRLAGVI